MRKSISQHLIDDAKALGLGLYKDPDCRDRVMVVNIERMHTVAEEVARPGGMRVSPYFIGSQRSIEAFLMGCSWVKHA